MKEREMATTSLTSWARQKKYRKKRTLFARARGKDTATQPHKAKKNWKRQNANRTLKKEKQKMPKEKKLLPFGFSIYFWCSLCTQTRYFSTSTFHCEMGPTSLFYAQPAGNLNFEFELINFLYILIFFHLISFFLSFFLSISVSI